MSKTTLYLQIALFASQLLFCPIMQAAEQITKAPGKGIIPAVSPHYSTQPTLYSFDQSPAQTITPGIKRRFILGTESSLVRWDLKSGVNLPVHFHINEQVTRVERGILVVYSQEKKYEMHAGDVMVFPPNVPHQFVAMRDTVIYEFHTPARQDFINGEFDNKAKHSFDQKQ